MPTRRGCHAIARHDPRSTRCSNCAPTGCPPFARSLRA
jgi:hypothetical protein